MSSHPIEENTKQSLQLLKKNTGVRAKTYINVRYLNEVVILAIDPATKSGWTIWSPQGYHGYGEVNVFAADNQIDYIIKQAKQIAERQELPLFVVAEKWTPHGLGNQSYAGLCATWGVWKYAIDNNGIKKKNLIRVYPQTWRTWSLGRKGIKREMLKKISINVASALVGAQVESDNAADAINISRWAQCCWNVGGKVPRRFTR